jgi:hypothetical protein
MGGSFHVRTDNGVASFMVKSFSHEGDNLVLNGGEAVLVPTHECGYDDEARRLGKGAASGERRLNLERAYAFCLKGVKLQDYTASECEIGKEVANNGWTSRNLQSLLECPNDLENARNDLENARPPTNLDSFFESMNISPAIGWLDVSQVTNFEDMFRLATTFNTDIGNWDVGNGVYFTKMFDGATSFNADIGNWNVERGTWFVRFNE